MGYLVVITVLVALALKVPISMALGLAALAGILYFDPAFLISLLQNFFYGIDRFPLLAIPLFILAGQIMGQGGIAHRMVNLAMALVGRLRGGLGMVSVLATMFFSGISGSQSADTAAIGSVTIPAMKKKGYPPEFATALIAAAGGTAALVPPSIDFIVIGIIANISIGGLFAAGFLPGAVNALGIMALVFYYGHKLDLPLEPRMPLKKKIRTIWEGSLAILMAVIILGGILGGIFTPTEASAVAVVYGFIVAVFVYKELKLKDIPGVLLHTCRMTGAVLFVMAFAMMLNYVLTIERIPHMIAHYIAEVSHSWIQFVFFVNVIFLFLGMLMDAMPLFIILMPIIVPAAVMLGMEPIHVGILIANNVAISLISPPVGVSFYVACSIGDTPVDSVIRPLIPFLLVLVGTLIIICYVPQITLFIPRLLGYVAG